MFPTSFRGSAAKIAVTRRFAHYITKRGKKEAPKKRKKQKNCRKTLKKTNKCAKIYS